MGKLVIDEKKFEDMLSSAYNTGFIEGMEGLEMMKNEVIKSKWFGSKRDEFISMMTRISKREMEENVDEDYIDPNQTQIQFD